MFFAHSPVPQDIHWGCWTGWINSKSLCTGYWLLDCHHGLGPWLPNFSPMQKYVYNILLCHKVLGLATTFPSIFGPHLKNKKKTLKPWAKPIHWGQILKNHQKPSPPGLGLYTQKHVFAHSPVPQDIHWGCWTGWINSKSLCTGYWLLDCHHGLGPWLPNFSPMEKYFYNILLCHKVLGLATTLPSIFGAHPTKPTKPWAKPIPWGQFLKNDQKPSPLA